MAFKGESPDNPVCVASVIVLDDKQERILLGARKEMPYEKRHLLSISTFTREVNPAVFKLLAGGDPATWPHTYRSVEDTGREFKIGHGRHGEATDILVVEHVLGKIGLTEALVEGAVRGVARPTVASLTNVEDKDTEKSEWTAMLSYEVTLDPETDYSRIPSESVAYDPIVWEPAALLPEAYEQNDVGILGDRRLDEKFLCITGACVASAALALKRLQK